ncbi:MAG: 6-bladed beta-propeller [Gemmatimonadaceae bacterium]
MPISTLGEEDSQMPARRPTMVWRWLVGSLVVIAVGMLGWHALRAATADDDVGPTAVSLSPADFHVSQPFAAPPGGFEMPMDVKSANGHVWIADYKAGRVFQFTSDGRYEQTIGRPGSGPGELKNPESVGLVGDTIWVLNSGNSRIEYFSMDGRVVGGQRLPPSVWGAEQMVAVGSEFVATVLFDTLPLVHFARNSNARLSGRVSATRFGSELGLRAKKTQGSAKFIPPSYRLQWDGDQLWVYSTYLPLVAIYRKLDEPPKLVTYPAPKIKNGRMEVKRDKGIERHIVTGPDPEGSVGLLTAPDQNVYLLTQQKSRDHKQVFYKFAPDGTLLGRAMNPLPTFIGFASSASDYSYAVSISEKTGAVDMLLLRWGDHQ